jgi:hypothetical protein
MSHLVILNLFNASADITVNIFMVNMYWLVLTNIAAVNLKVDICVLIGTNKYIPTLKMAVAVFAETLDKTWNIFQLSTRLIPESQRTTLNSSRETLRTRSNLRTRDHKQNVYTGESGSYRSK